MEEGEKEIYNELRDNGIVEESASAPGSWQITESAARRLVFKVQLQRPRPFMTVDMNSDVEKFSAFELMLFLEKRGWVCRTASDKDLSDPVTVTAELAGAAVFWVRATDTAYCLKYLLVLALACSSEKFMQSLLVAKFSVILHLQRSDYYSDFLEVFYLSKRPKANDIEFEDDHGRVSARGGVSARAGKRQKGYRLQESFRWGQVSFKFRRPTKNEPRAGFQVDCPRRSHIRWLPSGGRSMCCKSLRFDEDDRDEIVGLLKFWAASCMDFGGRAAHQRWTPSLDELPDEQALSDMMIPESRVLTDDEDVRAMQGVKRGARRKAAAETTFSSNGRKRRRRKGPPSAEPQEASAAHSAQPAHASTGERAEPVLESAGAQPKTGHGSSASSSSDSDSS